MKRVLNFAVAVSFIVMSGMGFAGSSKIAVVDLQQIMQNNPEMKNVQQKFEKDFMPKRDKLVQMEEGLKQDMEKFNRDSAVMSSAKKQEMQDKIMAIKQTFEKERQEYQQELSAAHNKAMQDLYEKVKVAVAEVAKKQGYDVVLQKDAAPFSLEKLDITEQVIAKIK